jgi:hypothetical protein
VIAVAFISGREAFIIIPSFILFTVIWLLKNRKSDQLKIFILLGGAVFLVIIGYLFVFIFFKEIGMRITANFVEQARFFLVRFFSVTYKIVLSTAFISTLFKSFWCYPGWMAFPLPGYIYNVLVLFSLLGIFGIIKYLFAYPFKSDKKTTAKIEYIVLLSAIVFITFVGTFLRSDPMARYTFVSLSAISILSAVGLREVIPPESSKIAIFGLICLLVILNFYTVFIHMARVFYFSY